MGSNRSRWWDGFGPKRRAARGVLDRAINVKKIVFKRSKESAKDSADDNIELQNRKNIEKFNAFRVGSSTWARTRDLRINRKLGSSKNHINHGLIAIIRERVIFRVIDQKL